MKNNTYDDTNKTENKTNIVTVGSNLFDDLIDFDNLESFNKQDQSDANNIAKKLQNHQATCLVCRRGSCKIANDITNEAKRIYEINTNVKQIHQDVEQATQPVTIQINDILITVPTHQAEYLAESIMDEAKMWHETAVEFHREAMRHDNNGDHEEAEESQALSQLQRTISTAIYHEIQIHTYCNVETCPKALKYSEPFVDNSTSITKEKQKNASTEPMF
jgi:hypothetical protein